MRCRSRFCLLLSSKIFWRNMWSGTTRTFPILLRSGKPTWSRIVLVQRLKLPVLAWTTSYQTRHGLIVLGWPSLELAFDCIPMQPGTSRNRVLPGFPLVRPGWFQAVTCRLHAITWQLHAWSLHANYIRITCPLHACN